MQTVPVSLFDRSYSIHIGPSATVQADVWGAWVSKASSVVIVSNEVVAPLYLPQIREKILTLGKRVVEVILPDGEAHKTAASLDIIYSTMLANQCDRKSLLIALGGGVVGDVGGYAAATYQRGIPFIQMPTTLLAQVDSSVGGKTAVNHPLGKNMIGAFYQPVAVMSDTSTLKTLPPREFAAGMAEIVKHALIFDAPHLAELERDALKINARDPETLARIIAHSCRIKADVVKRDERETLGLRALLNLGHTFGHAIETEMGYGVWLHGEAVAVGCVLAAKLSCELGHLSSAEVDRVIKVFQGFKLPTEVPDVAAKDLLTHMQIDKKNENGSVILVLLKTLGEAYLERGMSQAALLDFWKRNGAV